MKGNRTLGVLLLITCLAGGWAFAQDDPPTFSDLAKDYFDADALFTTASAEAEVAEADVSVKTDAVAEAQAALDSAQATLDSTNAAKDAASTTKNQSQTGLVVVVKEGERSRATIVAEGTLLIAVYDPANPNNVRIELVPLE